MAILNPSSTDLYYYHGTSLDQAKTLMTMDIGVMEVAANHLLDWWEYTDFGKGFYTHPHETRKLAVVWAKKKNKDWGVVRFALTKQEFDSIPGRPLYFQTKRSRPDNAPVIAPPRPATWLEFVEYNRDIRTQAQRPKDKDWTGRYGWMRGPIWTRQDSGLGASDIRVVLPDDVHQINWGRDGLTALNTPAAKARRFLFTKDNERFLGDSASDSSGSGKASDSEEDGSHYHGGGGTSGGGGSSDSY